ncbi:hypothetical protein PsorP6_014527 [Peronosclerospora sorghi]|uniref:Uncharacterized protein n=1 Tax=Peronosclerospora sorghi TaxID=230839 RepID=A0ACC0VTV1_9STRA|nr:hypothetical protein PsorP6_014527 [Peronosclerospora sorghi]
MAWTTQNFSSMSDPPRRRIVGRTLELASSCQKINSIDQRLARRISLRTAKRDYKAQVATVMLEIRSPLAFPRNFAPTHFGFRNTFSALTFALFQRTGYFLYDHGHGKLFRGCNVSLHLFALDGSSHSSLSINTLERIGQKYADYCPMNVGYSFFVWRLHELIESRAPGHTKDESPGRILLSDV